MLSKISVTLAFAVVGLMSVLLTACGGASQAQAQQQSGTAVPAAGAASDNLTEPDTTGGQESSSMIVQFVKFKSGLSDEEVRQNIDDRGPEFRALTGIVQKFYVQEKDTGEWGGIYIWDSEESMQAFRASDLAKTIPGVYQVQGTPRVEIFHLYKPLRTDAQALPQNPAIVQFVKFKSGLSDEEVRQNIDDRGPDFRALSGIVQKFYVQEKDTGEWGGIYIWDSEESMQAFRASDLAKAIPGVYQVEGTPRVEIFQLYKPLRSEVNDLAFSFK